ncbi:hypothetical protein Hanom_Chr03g00267301 [Helianthus anomalus]
MNWVEPSAMTEIESEGGLQVTTCGNESTMKRDDDDERETRKKERMKVKERSL